jgi:CheY-like chemotaxis protein
MRPSFRLPDLSNLSILVVDDDDDSLELVTTFLKACGANVVFARTAVAALAYLEMTPNIDVVITDIVMPQMDGVEFARKIKEERRRRPLCVIALTAFYEDYPRCVDFDACLRKPVNFEGLSIAISLLLREAA